MLNEREIYIQKLKAQINGMQELLNPKFNDVISTAKSSEILALKVKAEKLLKKLSDNEFEIAIIGLEKAGKSTFANALMGNNILPSMDARCTYTSTSIRYGADDYGEIRFYTFDEFSQKFTDSLKTMGIEHAESLSFSTLSIDRYRQYFESLSDEKKNYYRASVNEDVENIIINQNTLMQYIGAGTKIYRGASQLESMEFKKFIQDPAYAVAVKEITIHSSKFENMQNAVLYDVPGFDSPTQIHREQTIQMMSTADVIILLANTGKPSITGPQVQIFEGEVDGDGIPFNEKTFIFANKADTAFDALEKNIGVLKKDLDRFRIVRREFIDSRIVIGSARAKLEAEGKILDENGEPINTGLCEKLMEKGISDGIGIIQKKLEDYNNTERFETLKKRINRIYSELENCLAPELEILSRDKDNNMNFTEISAIAIKLLNQSQNKIIRELSRLHSEVPRMFNYTNPLTEKFRTLISNVTSENYGVSEEEKDDASVRVGTTGGNIAIDGFERVLRDDKYNQIYNFFIKSIVDLVIETHREYDSKVEDIFMDALSVSETHPFHDEILAEVRSYLSKINSEGKEGYYRSLSERFTTDLLETLIRQNFGGRDRWAAFEDRKLNLHSLSIFYTDKDTSLPPEKQPMLYAILFHDYTKSETDEDSKSYVDDMKNAIVNHAPNINKKDLDKLDGHLKKVSDEKGEMSLYYINNLCEKAKRRTNDPERFIAIIRKSLDTDFNTAEESIAEKPTGQSSEINFESYNERCTKEKLNSTNIDEVCEHINKDIDILGDLLLKAAIPAIQIDKAFIYYEVRCIENIITSVTPDSSSYRFDDFITRNTDRIACSQITDIKINEKKRLLRQEICIEIQRIFDSVKNFSKQ